MTGRNYLSGFFKGEPLSRDRDAPADIPARKATNITPIIDFVLEDPNFVQEVEDPTNYDIDSTDSAQIVNPAIYIKPTGVDAILKIKSTSIIDVDVSSTDGVKSVLVYRNSDDQLVPFGFSAFHDTGDDQTTERSGYLDATMVNSDGFWEVYAQYRPTSERYPVAFEMEVKNNIWDYNVFIADEIPELNPVGSEMYSGDNDHSATTSSDSTIKKATPVRSLSRSSLSSGIQLDVTVKGRFQSTATSIVVFISTNVNGDLPSQNKSDQSVLLERINADGEGIVTQTISFYIDDSSGDIKSWDYVLCMAFAMDDMFAPVISGFQMTEYNIEYLEE